MSTSVLDDLGKEVTGILAPVSLCMALTVALVKTINSSDDDNRNSVIIATAYYEEEARRQLHCPHSTPSAFQDEDSAGTKLSGSIVNALIFVAFITLITFVLFFLFKHGVHKHAGVVLIAKQRICCSVCAASMDTWDSLC